MRKITIKQVQVISECKCGLTEVYPDEILIKWSELSKIGIKRKKDKSGTSFLLMKFKTNSCYDCNPDN